MSWVTDALRRAAATLVATIAAFCAIPSPAVAAPETPSVTDYTYASQLPQAVVPPSVIERGPPTTTYDYHYYGAVDRWSHGAFARPEPRATPPMYIHDDLAELVQAVQAVQATGTTWEPARVSKGQLAEFDQGVVAAKTATGAESALSGALLKTHLRQLEKYGAGGFRELQSGRIRYYGELSAASKAGDMVGRRLVREWDPASGACQDFCVSDRSLVVDFSYR